jgi:DNA modification methylase
MASIEDGAIDCIVTSPPYGNVSDNVMSQRLSMLWLDYDLTEVRNREIGARWKRFRKLSLQDYVAEMKDGLTQMKRVLAPKGRLALVIGSSPKWEKGYPTVPLIDSFISQDLCMEELGQFKRVVGPSRQHGSFGVIEEHILVYRKR